jgi:uncharacterized protein YgiM (DUF1202 family)
MSRRNLSDEWRLEEGEAQPDQWKLEPAEQNAITQWQLEGSEPPVPDWQPVDYAREQPGSGGGNWVLPALVGIALVGVVSYVAWIGLNRMGLFDSATTEPQPTAAVAVAPTTETTPGEQPTNTPEAATFTPTPEPSPTATPIPTPTATQIPLVPLQSIYVNTAGGVNARREPNLTAEVIRILPQGEEFLVNAEQPDWIQVALPERQLAWVAAEFVERRSATVTLDEANQRREAVGLPLLSVQPPATDATGTLTGTTPLTGTAVNPLPAAPAPVTTSPRISVTVSITTGLNARQSPSLDATIVRQLEGNSSFTAFARSEDSQWLQVQLPEGTTAWVFAELVTITGDINTLPTPAQLPAVGASAPVTATTPLTSTPGVTGTATSTVTAVSGATASVIALAGASARATQDRAAEPLQVLPFDSVVPVIGRSANGEWVQVTLEEGIRAWVLLETVQVSTDPATLPVVNP